MITARKTVMFCHAILILLLTAHYTTGEWFTSIGHMEDLFNEELSLLDFLKQYLQSEKTKLNNVKSFLGRAREIVPGDYQRYVENPISQYLLMFRFQSDWKEIFQTINFTQSEPMVDPFKDLLPYFPTEEDVYGAMHGLMRIRKVYDLPVDDIANGIVGSDKKTSPLVAMDLMEFGKQAVVEGDYSETITWLREAAIKVEEGDETCSRPEIFYVLSRSFFDLGNVSFSYLLLQETLKSEPNNTYVDEFHNQIREAQNQTKPRPTRFEISDIYDREIDLEVPKQSEQKTNELCRRKSHHTPEYVRKRLHCFLWDNNKNPRLLLRPAKIEELWIAPNVLRIYDILSEGEIRYLISTSKYQLQRALVVNPDSSEPVSTPSRITKNAFLDEYSSSILLNINQRIIDISGLDSDNSEMLSIANYGVGGHYVEHSDFLDSEIDRIATMLFYLNDVKQGGNTIFLTDELTIPPIKGSAIFWFNLLESGKPDKRTLHAACPVITGTKWIANKWLRTKSECTVLTCKHPPCEDKHRKILLSD